MNVRAYIMLSLIKGTSDGIFRSLLQYKPGIVAVDILDGPPDVMLVIEAPTREKLSILMTEILINVEPLIDSYNLLPVENTSKVINYRIRPVITAGTKAGTQTIDGKVMKNKVQIIQERQQKRLQAAVS